MIGKDIIFSRKSDEWRTPLSLLKSLRQKFNIIYDLAATQENAIELHYCINLNENNISVIKDDFMQIFEPNKNQVAFCNPPYSKCKKFVQMCILLNIPIIMLLPARTDTQWFHNYLYKKDNIKIEFIKGRLKFSNNVNNAPFPNLLAFINI